MSRIGEFYGNTGERAKAHPAIATLVGLGILAAGAAGLDYIQEEGIDLPNLSTISVDLPDLPKIGGSDAVSPESTTSTTEAPVTTTTAPAPESTTTTVAPIETTTTIESNDGVDLSPVGAPGQ